MEASGHPLVGCVTLWKLHLFYYSHLQIWDNASQVCREEQIIQYTQTSAMVSNQWWIQNKMELLVLLSPPLSSSSARNEKQLPPKSVSINLSKSTS